MFDKDKIKNSLTIEQVFDLVDELGGEPIMYNGFFVSLTICHDGDSHKLYYYDNTKLFQCYTNCGMFDVYELIQKIQNIEMFDAVKYIVDFFHIEGENENFPNGLRRIRDWEIFKKYKENNLKNQRQIINLSEYDKKILKYLPRPQVEDWIQEGISEEVMRARGIAYDPVFDGVVIPHYDIDGRLIGVRERTLCNAAAAEFGKYRPAILNNKMYNHSLGFNLYNLNFSKDNIRLFKKAILFEGEKSCLKYASYFGLKNDISVAVCGSNLIKYQVQLLLNLGVEEVIVAFDKQYKEVGDEESKKWVKKFLGLNQKYSKYVRMSFLFDDEGLLRYKDSPVDEGKDIFLRLFEKRVGLN